MKKKKLYKRNFCLFSYEEKEEEKKKKRKRRKEKEEDIHQKTLILSIWVIVRQKRENHFLHFVFKTGHELSDV